MGGTFGVKWFLMALSDMGRPDLALESMLKTEYPSFGYMLNNEFANATTIWESWFFSNDTYSHNHPEMGSVETWLMQALAGIQPHPAARAMDRVIIKCVRVASWVVCAFVCTICGMDQTGSRVVFVL